MNTEAHADLKLVTHIIRRHVLAHTECLWLPSQRFYHLLFSCILHAFITRSSQTCHWIVIETSAASLCRWRPEFHLGGAVPKALPLKINEADAEVYQYELCIQYAFVPRAVPGAQVSTILAQEITIQTIKRSMKNMSQQHLHISCYEALITVKHWPSHTKIQLSL